MRSHSWHVLDLDPIQSSSHLQIHSAVAPSSVLILVAWGGPFGTAAQPSSHAVTWGNSSTVLPKHSPFNWHQRSVHRPIWSMKGGNQTCMPLSRLFWRVLSSFHNPFIHRTMLPGPKQLGQLWHPRASGLQHHISFILCWCRCHFVYDVHICPYNYCLSTVIQAFSQSQQWFLSATIDILSNISEAAGPHGVSSTRKFIQGTSRADGLGYPLANKHSYGKSPFIVDIPIQHGDFP